MHRQQRLLGDPRADLLHSEEESYTPTAARTAAMLSPDSLDRLLSDRADRLQSAAGDFYQAASQVAVMDSRDVYVSLVLSIGSPFGSGEFSQGFLLNNALAAFDLSQPSGEGEVGSNQVRENIKGEKKYSPTVKQQVRDRRGIAQHIQPNQIQ